jgi:hypothetical protein
MSIPVLLAVAAMAAPAARGELDRDEFPPGFLFGTVTSAYQVRVALVCRRHGRIYGYSSVFAGIPQQLGCLHPHTSCFVTIAYRTMQDLDRILRLYSEKSSQTRGRGRRKPQGWGIKDPNPNRQEPRFIGVKRCHTYRDEDTATDHGITVYELVNDDDNRIQVNRLYHQYLVLVYSF